jgi:hypothetical protein
VKPIKDVDDHLVAHDVASITVAGVLGAAAVAVTGSPEAGIAAAGVIATTGIGGMKVGPVRRTVNRATLAVAEIGPLKKVPGRKS